MKTRRSCSPLARGSTAAQLERVVRAHRGITRQEAEQIHVERSLSWWFDDSGAMVLQARLSPDEGAVLLKAIAAAREREAATWDAPAAAVPGADPSEGLYAGVSREGDGEGEAVTARAAPPGPGERDLDALVLLAEESLTAAARTRTPAAAEVGGAAGAATPASRTGGDRFQVVVHLDVEALTSRASSATSEGSVDAQSAGGRAWLEDGAAALARETVRRLGCDAALVGIVERDGDPLHVGRKTRTIPPALRRALRARDGGCRFPGCTQTRWVDAHHIVHWANGGRTDLENLVHLCRHHHRLVHEGGFAVIRTADGVVEFRRPDGRLLHAVPEPAGGADAGRLVASDLRAGRGIGPMTIVPDWYGDRMDLGRAVDALLAVAPVPRGHGDGDPTGRAPTGAGASAEALAVGGSG